MEVNRYDSARYVAQQVADKVVAQLPNDTPPYTDANAKFYWLKIDTFAQEKIKVINLGIRAAAAKKQGTPQKKNAAAKGEKRGGIYDPTRVGKMFIGNSAAEFYHTDNGFRIQMQREKSGYDHVLNNKDERLYDGQLFKERVLQLTINLGEEYEVGLLLAKTQLPIAEKALEALRKTRNEWDGEVGETTEREKQKVETILVTMEREEETVETTLVTMEIEEEKVEMTLVTKEESEEKVEKKEEKDKGAAGKGYGAGTCLLLAAGLSVGCVGVAVRLGYVRVPTGVSTWMVDKQDWVLNKWEQVRPQAVPSTLVKV